MKWLALALALAAPLAAQAQTVAIQRGAAIKGFVLTDKLVASADARLPLEGLGASSLFYNYMHNIAQNRSTAHAAGIELSKEWMGEGFNGKELMSVAAGYQYNTILQPQARSMHEIYGLFRTRLADIKGTIVPPEGFAPEIFLHYTPDTAKVQQRFTVGARYGFAQRYFLEDSSRIYTGLHLSVPLLTTKSHELVLSADAQLKLNKRAQNGTAVGLVYRPRRKEQL